MMNMYVYTFITISVFLFGTSTYVLYMADDENYSVYADKYMPLVAIGGGCFSVLLLTIMMKIEKLASHHSRYKIKTFNVQTDTITEPDRTFNEEILP